MPASVLFCADPLNPRRVDAHFAAQAAVVRDLGGTVVLLDHDALLAGRTAEAVGRVPRTAGPLWYRGWMIPTGRYAELAAALAERGCSLVVGPDDYAAAHELPGWYAAFAALTPESVWSAGVPASVTELVEALPRTGPALVKDYVKSRKHDWDTACHIPDLADAAAVQGVVDRFVELQGEDLAGGVVLRVFEDFGDPGTSAAGRPAEARVWWLDGVPVLVGPHPDTPDDFPVPDLGAVGPAVRTLNRRFVTTDLARRADGVWRVIEVGDGQVSDLPATVDPRELFVPLLRAGARAGWQPGGSALKRLQAG